MTAPGSPAGRSAMSGGGVGMVVPGRGGWVLGAGAALLTASGSLLTAAAEPGALLLASVALHLALGLGLLVPFAVWWWRRREQPGMRLAGTLLLSSAAAGCLLIALGNRESLRP